MFCWCCSFVNIFWVLFLLLLLILVFVSFLLRLWLFVIFFNCAAVFRWVWCLVWCVCRCFKDFVVVEMLEDVLMVEVVIVCCVCCMVLVVLMIFICCLNWVICCVVVVIVFFMLLWEIFRFDNICFLVVMRFLRCVIFLVILLINDGLMFLFNVFSVWVFRLVLCLCKFFSLLWFNFICVSRLMWDFLVLLSLVLVLWICCFSMCMFWVFLMDFFVWEINDFFSVNKFFKIFINICFCN